MSKQQYNLNAVGEFLTTQAEPTVISRMLDDACFNMARAALSNGPETMTGDVDQQLWYLRQLRDLFNEV